MILTPLIEAYPPPHFNLERTSLSLIVFGFRKATLGGDGRVLLSLLGHVYRLFSGFHTTDSVLDNTLFQVLYYHQLFCLVFETKQFSLPILFFQFLNKRDPLCIHVLLSTALIAQDGYIFLLLNKFFIPYNLSTYAIDSLYTLQCYDCA